MNTHRKVPEVALAFWVMKICATTLGETAGDLFSMTLKVGYAVSSIILVSAFVLSLASQLLSKHYRPPLYWMVILTTSTAGTTMSDYIDRTLGLGYAKGSAILVGLLLCVLAAWWKSTGSLSVDRIDTRKGEIFYWVAILLSNTLGTALGETFLRTIWNAAVNTYITEANTIVHLRDIIAVAPRMLVRAVVTRTRVTT